MTYKSALYELKQEDLDVVCGGVDVPLPIIQIAVIVRSSYQTITQHESHLDVITNNVLRVSRPIGPPIGND